MLQVLSMSLIPMIEMRDLSWYYSLIKQKGDPAMQLPRSEQLNVAGLSRLFDNKSECYKLFWFQAILDHVCDGQQEFSFEELIDAMIESAWYMVTLQTQLGFSLPHFVQN